MTRNALVLDASAIIAEIKGEPGAEAIRQIIDMPPSGGIFMHSVNVCEVAIRKKVWNSISCVTPTRNRAKGTTSPAP